MARGMRAARQAALQEAAEVGITPVATWVGQVIWYVVTYPLRLVLRAFDVYW